MPPTRTKPQVRPTLFCSYCSKQFKKQGFLNRHLQKHFTPPSLPPLPPLSPILSAPNPRKPRIRRAVKKSRTTTPQNARYVVPFGTVKVRGRPTSKNNPIDLCTPSPPPAPTWANQRPAPRWQVANTRQATPGPGPSTTGLGANECASAPRGKGGLSQQKRTQLYPYPRVRTIRRGPLTGDSSNASERSVAGSVSSERSTTSQRRMRQKRLRRAGTHTRFESSDEDVPVNNTSRSSHLSKASSSVALSRASEEGRDGETIDLDGISLPSHLGRRSTSVHTSSSPKDATGGGTPPSNKPAVDSSCHHVRSSSHQTSDSPDQEIMATPRSRDNSYLPFPNEVASEVESEPPRKRPKRLQSVPKISSRSGSEPCSGPASRSTSEHASPPRSASSRDSEQPQSPPPSRYRHRSLSHDSDGASETSHPHSERTTASQARNYASSFDPAALADSLQQFLSRTLASVPPRENAGQSSQTQPQLGVRDVRSVVHHPLPPSLEPVHPPHSSLDKSANGIPWTEGQSSSTASKSGLSKLRRPQSPLHARVRDLRAEEVMVSSPGAAPTPGPPTPCHLRSSKHQAASTPGPPKPPLVIVTSAASTAPTPFFPTRRGEKRPQTSSIGTQTDTTGVNNSMSNGDSASSSASIVPNSNSGPQANGYHHSSPYASNVKCSPHVHQHQCTACSCVVANLLSNLIHWVHDSAWFACECDRE